MHMGPPEQLRKPCTSQRMTLPSTETWGNTSYPTSGMSTTGHPFDEAKVTAPAPPSPTMGTPINISYQKEHNKFFIGNYGPFSPLTGGAPLSPLTENYNHSGAILVSRHFLLSLTFCIDLMKWLQYGSHESWYMIKNGNLFCVSTTGNTLTLN